jgi:hypothetical protein
MDERCGELHALLVAERQLLDLGVEALGEPLPAGTVNVMPSSAATSP